jgi:hypothetical protein
MRDYFDPSYETEGPLIIPSDPLQYAHRRHQHDDTVTSTSMARSRSTISREDGSSSMSIKTTIPVTNEPSNAKRPVSLMYEGEDNAVSTSCLDCQSLQSSLKRVKLSCSPGELRLQHDLKMLSPHEWQVEGTPQDQNGDYHTTIWTHVSTRARLKLVDSLRLYLFLPTDATVGFNHKNSNQRHQHHHQHHHHHYGRYHWRMMIQIPRMFPHRPPVVLRMEGNLWVKQIVISETPPARSRLSRSLLRSPPSSPSILEMHHVLEHTTNRPILTPPMFSALSLSHNNIAEGMSNNNNNYSYQIFDDGKTVVWDKWSPIATLGDLLDVLLSVANQERDAASGTAAVVMQTDNRLSNESSRVVLPEERGWTWSPVSSSVLSSCHCEQSTNISKVVVDQKEFSMLRHTTNTHTSKPYCEEEHKLEDATMNMGYSPMATKFLTPNRFDVGYDKDRQGVDGEFSSHHLLRSQQNWEEMGDGMMEIN